LDQSSGKSDDEEDEDNDSDIVFHNTKLTINVAVFRILVAFIISLSILGGCFWIMLNPFDDRAEEAAITLATTIVAGWVTYFSAIMRRN
jgi:hypothetical protein